ncbi:MAG: heme-binding protein [Betaproteobacteria bacterium]|nr:MAG: heme-binding protein [Betaproteobacteria bacterium]
MKKLSLLASVFVLASATTAAQAQVISQRTIGLELANRIAAATVKACADKGYAVTATVVDRAGLVRAVQRADNAGPHTIGASQAKAYTAASARNATSAMLETSQKNAGAANLGDIPGFLVLGGGVPVKAGDEVVGAVGVGGAPGGHLDEQCAVAGIEGAADLLK